MPYRKKLEEILNKEFDEYSKIIHSSRIRILNDKPVNDDGRYVLYWCQSSPRTNNNPALEFAIQKANDHALGLLVCTGTLVGYPLATERHATFMIEGLQELKQGLAFDRGIRLFVGKNSPDSVAIQLAKYAVEVIVDMSYLRVHRQWYERVAKEISCTLTQIEANIVVPVELVSSIEEPDDLNSFRIKLDSHLDEFLKPVPKLLPDHCSLTLNLPSDVDFDELIIYEIGHAIDLLSLDRSVKRVLDLKGGYCSAVAHLKRFVSERLPHFATSTRDNPGHDLTSRMSPYLNFGHISPIEILLAVRNAEAPNQAKKLYFDRIFVQRELAINTAWYNVQYDSLYPCGMPCWALKTMEKHKSDKRPYIYSLKQLEAAETDDPLWNAAQLEMVHTGQMHTFIRFYWGKKVMEWSADMNTAFNYLVYLNDKYEMDGRDPNSYAGIAECFGKFSSPSSREVPIFGTIPDYDSQDLKALYGQDLNNYTLNCYLVAGRTPPF